jgi:hypothetical protein
VLEEGRIAEVGTHEELLAKPDGLYRNLVEIQDLLSGPLAEDKSEGDAATKTKGQRIG